MFKQTDSRQGGDFDQLAADLPAAPGADSLTDRVNKLKADGQNKLSDAEAIDLVMTELSEARLSAKDTHRVIVNYVHRPLEKSTHQTAVRLLLERSLHEDLPIFHQYLLDFLTAPVGEASADPGRTNRGQALMLDVLFTSAAPFARQASLALA